MEHHFTKSQKLVAFFFLFGIFFVVVAILASVNRIQDKQAFTYQPRATETDTSAVSSEGEITSLRPQRYSSETNRPLTISEIGIDVSTIEIKTSESGCEYGVYMGYGGGPSSGKIMCSNKDNKECSYSALIYCPLINKSFIIRRSFCSEKEEWENVAKDICCDMADINCERSTNYGWFEYDDKDYCDAFCFMGSHNEKGCVPKEKYGRWGWYCAPPPVCTQPGGGDQPLPIEPINNTQ